MRKISIFYKLVMIAACMFFVSCYQNAQNGIIKKAKKNAYMLKHVLSQNGPIEFYAKVVDQFKQPVPNATVKCTTHFFSVLGKPPYFISGKAFDVKTDKNGLFEIKNMSGIDLAIVEVTKDGYEYIMDPDNDTFEFENKSPTSHIADKNKPVLFKMRKRKYKPEFLLTAPVSYSSKIDSILYYDIIGQLIKRKVQWQHDNHADIEVTASFDDENNQYTCLLKALDPNSGIQVLNKNLFFGPNSGYKKEVIIKIPFDGKNESETDELVYVKGKNGLFFSKLRMNFQARIGTDNLPHLSLRIKKQSYTNPYGRPNFEYDPDFYDKMSSQEWEEAKEEAETRLSKR